MYRNQYGQKKLPDDLAEVIRSYGRLGNWKQVAEYYGCAESTIKNAIGPFLAGHGFRSVGHAIWYLFVNENEDKHYNPDGYRTHLSGKV